MDNAKTDCIFCSIERGVRPAYKFYDDGEFYAVLDINPNTPGMSLVVPKRHYESYAFSMPDDVLSQFIIACKRTANLLEKKLPCNRVGMIMEGIGIDHTHMKLYPMHGLKHKYESIVHPEKVFFDQYPGYLTSKLGPKATKNDLEKMWHRLTRP